ncbi:AraC family transcriptional regulator [Clostridioides mangenotii]|uniref:AraC family transcriptional regulator n=1 Tax=Metaclostridioides mangenotii TaxID=1540 RepID=UPI001C11F1E2|nr:AraC family transcriptional regulator [Clostridioides mangenotii]MBU5308238.1 AraC family transcriptional regulator [Clostridioides mangenotii]
MEWLKNLNEALDYIEDNLKGEIKYNKAAKIACCSTYHFQRMFSYISGTPLSEYIRRRRLTMAAFDLQSGDKVINVAMRYGYESPTSFNRAFQNIHGISPSAAQKEGVCLKAFPRITFKISIKGVAEMDYKIIKKDAFRIIGVKEKLKNDIESNFETVPKMWREVAKSGTLAELVPLMNKEPLGVLGVSACIGDEVDWEYYIAVSSDKQTPEGMCEYEVPGCTWAVFTGEGPMPTAIQDIEKRAITEWLPTSGYEYGDAPDIEVYLNEDPQNSKFEVWVPIVKK